MKSQWIAAKAVSVQLFSGCPDQELLAAGVADFSTELEGNFLGVYGRAEIAPF